MFVPCSFRWVFGQVIESVAQSTLASTRTTLRLDAARRRLGVAVRVVDLSTLTCLRSLRSFQEFSHASSKIHRLRMWKTKEENLNHLEHDAKTDINREL